MNPPEKSSDEILKELFGLCQQTLTACSDESSQDESSDSSSDSEGDSRSRKHKHKRKKKKKHKKMKKRRKATNDEESDSKLFQRKLKKIKKEPGVEDESSSVSKVELKIKAEKDDLADILSKQRSTSESSQNKENKSNNYVNTITGKLITLDDVFHTLGIVTEGPMTSKIKREKTEEIVSHVKQEKEFILLRPEEIKKEKLDENEEANRVKKERDNELNNKQEFSEVQDFEGSNTPGVAGKTNISEIFPDEADKQISSSKKISIKNLKNSLVYEATMKEIEEREKYRAEKYEEGELSTDSNSSEDELVDLNRKDENLSKSSDEHKKRHENHDRTKKHRSHKSGGGNCSSKKKHRHEGSRNKHKDSHKPRKLDHAHRSTSDSLKSRSHQHSERARSHSVDSVSSVLSKRSRKSTHRSRREKSSRERSRSSSRSRIKSNHFKSEYECVEKIDKQKLLEIARKNAINLLQQGVIPASIMGGKTKLASIKAGGKTVDELTDFCKQLSRREAEGDDSDQFSSGSENGDTKVAFHHPFQLKERPSSIIMNIRNAIPLPTKTAQEKTLELSKQLSLQYPVSSGQQHQSEWVPVEKSDSTVSTQISSSYSNALVDPTAVVAYPLPQTAAYQFPSQYQPPSVPQTSSTASAPRVDISNIVAQRLEAIRRLNENPQDPIGVNLIQTANSKMNVWAESKVQPGFFTGSTGVKPLSAAELSGGYKAWPKKVDILTFSKMLHRLIRIPPGNQFVAAKPVSSDKGEALMKKMGWQPGEGLGKYKQGPAAPCEISMKTDRKGLAEQPMPKGFKQSNTLQMAIDIAQNKHPVSLLNEFCSRRKLPTPSYDCEEKEGTAKKKLFLFSVTVQGLRYTPSMPSPNKKQSKMEAATVCLQALGLLPTVAPIVAE